MSNKRRILNVLLGVLICVAVYQLAQHEFLPKDERIRREQLITDFVDAAFEGAWDGNERVSLHKWEQDEIPIYFTRYTPSSDGMHYGVTTVSHFKLPADLADTLDDDLAFCYKNAYQIVQDESPAVEKITSN